MAMLWFLQMVKVCQSGLSHASTCTIHPKRWKSFSFFRASGDGANHMRPYSSKSEVPKLEVTWKSQQSQPSKRTSSRRFAQGKRSRSWRSRSHKSSCILTARSSTRLLPILSTSACARRLATTCPRSNLTPPEQFELSNVASCTMQLRCGIWAPSLQDLFHWRHK